MATNTAPVTDTHDTTADVTLPAGGDPFDAATEVSRGTPDMVDDMVDVRDNAMTEDENTRFQDDLAARKSTPAQAAKPDALAGAVSPLKPAAAPGAAVALGEMQLSAEQASRLGKMFPKGMEPDKAIELLESAMKGGNSLFSSVQRNVEEKRQQAAAIRKQGMQELNEAKALKRQAEDLIKRIGGGQAAQDPRMAQQAQQQLAAELDPNDPFHKPLIPLYQTVQALQTQLQQMQNYKDPYSQHQITTGFNKLQQQLGDRFTEAVVSASNKLGMPLKQNEYGEYDLSQLDVGQALAVQQEVVAHTESVKQYSDTFDQWYAASTKDLSLLPKSPFMNRAFWAQVQEDIDNGVQATPERFRQLALQMENELRSGVQSLATQQATVRDNAGVPVVSTAGATTSASVEGNEKPINYRGEDGSVDWDGVGRQVKARILPTLRRR